jgi:hypothetical protein
VDSGFIDHPLYGEKGMRAARSSRGQADARRRLGTHFAKALGVYNRLHTEPVALLFADAELGNNGFVPFRVVLLQVVEQTTTPAHHHEKSAARAVIFLVRFEVFRQLTNALAQQRDLNFGTAGIGSVRAIRVNDGLLLLSG